MDIKEKLSDRLLSRWEKTLDDVSTNTRIGIDRLQELRDGSGDELSDKEKKVIDSVLASWEERKVIPS